MELILRLPGILTAIILHELGHGYMAYFLGDNTAKDAGRLSLNPIRHIDPIGFLSMLIFKFGWAKPVPIDSRNFKNRKKGIFLVSISGPMVNFILALFTSIIYIYLVDVNVIFSYILYNILWYNIMLGIFNILPFPPLDGSKILASLLPIKLEYYFYKYERYLSLILIILIFTNRIDKIMTPLITGFISILNKILALIFK